MKTELFRVIERESGKTYRLFMDGSTKGFDGDVKVFVNPEFMQGGGVEGDGDEVASAAGTRNRPITVTKPSHLRDAEQHIDPTPSDALKEAGTYKKAHVIVQGFDITLETAKGGERSGKGKDGKKWAVTMPCSYGYVKSTRGADGEHFDVFIGDHPESKRVWVIDQVDAGSKAFDEHKGCLAFLSRAEALGAYERSFSDGKGGDRASRMRELTLQEFRLYLAQGNLKKPIGGTHAWKAEAAE